MAWTLAFFYSLTNLKHYINMSVEWMHSQRILWAGSVYGPCIVMDIRTSHSLYPVVSLYLIVWCNNCSVEIDQLIECRAIFSVGEIAPPVKPVFVTVSSFWPCAKRLKKIITCWVFLSSNASFSMMAYGVHLNGPGLSVAWFALARQATHTRIHSMVRGQLAQMCV